jgi:hypothetical protein
MHKRPGRVKDQVRLIRDKNQTRLGTAHHVPVSIPDTVATHPCVFATLTAPSFGPVHTHRGKERPIPALPTPPQPPGLPTRQPTVMQSAA